MSVLTSAAREPGRRDRRGLEILDRLPAVAAEASRTQGVDFGMRIGVHTGTVSVGTIGVDLRVDYTALGATARLAAALLAGRPPRRDGGDRGRGGPS